MKIRTVLATSYILLVVIPFALFFYLFYNTSKAAVLNIAKQNMSEISQKVCVAFDDQLLEFEEASRMLVVDDRLYNIFSGNGYTPFQLFRNDKTVTEILDQSFPQRSRNYAISIVTPEIVYGSSIYSSMNDFYNADIYKMAAEHEGTLFWVPAWTLPNELVNTDKLGATLSNVYRFAAIRVMRPMSKINGIVVDKIPDELPGPVLLMTFDESYIQQQFDGAVALDGFIYCISDQHGNLIAHSGEIDSTVEDIPWLTRAAHSKSEIFSAEYQGEEMVVSYVVSDVTGWVISFMVPYQSLLGNVDSMKPVTVWFIAILIFVTSLFAYIISRRISGPINELVDAVELAGAGDFKQRLQVVRKDEIGRLIRHFNKMNERLHTLVDENYRVRLRQKETQIAALTTQLNPHFLYNTLNLISMEALDNNAPSVSKMLIDLSRMLQYTVLIENEMATFQEDIDWIQKYVEIMRLRHGERYEVVFDIDDSLYTTEVPRLFLQPLLENAMIHGMKSVKAGGLITVIGYLDHDMRVFIIKDNGCGMDSNMMTQINHGKYQGVGLTNVQKRIRLIYGDDYGITVDSALPTGLVITVKIPL